MEGWSNVERIEENIVSNPVMNEGPQSKKNFGRSMKSLIDQRRFQWGRNRPLGLFLEKYYLSKKLWKFLSFMGL
jgi:hypothetical protein